MISSRHMDRQGEQMKSFYWMIFFSLFLLGCTSNLNTTTASNSTTTSTSPTETSTSSWIQTTTTTFPNKIPFQNVIGDTQYAIITLVLRDEEDFHYVIDQVEVDLTRNRVIVTVTIEDLDFSNQIYILRCQAQNHVGNKIISLLAQSGPVSTYHIAIDHFSHSGIYDFVLYKRVLIPGTNLTKEIGGDVGLEISIPQFNSLKSIGKAYLGNIDDQYYSNLSMTIDDYNQQRSSFSIQDPQRAITTAKWAVYEKASNTLVAEETFPTSSIRTSTGKLDQDFIMRNLIMGYEYRLVLMVSGHNGIFAFQDLIIGEKTFHLSIDPSMVHYNLNQFGYLKSFSLLPTGVQFRAAVMVKNPILDPQTSQIVPFFVRIRNADDEIVYEEEISQTTDRLFFVENQYLGFYHMISIENSDRSFVFAKLALPFQAPQFFFSLFGKTSELTDLKMMVKPRDATIISGEVRIYDQTFLIATIPFTSWIMDENVTLTIPRSLDQYRVEIDVTYSGYQATDQMTENRENRTLQSSKSY